MNRILIAFDKFKNSLEADPACRIAGKQLADIQPEWEIDLCPLTDGGEGFAEILVNRSGGRWIPTKATGARGARLEAGVGVVEIRNIPAAVREILGTLPTDTRIGIVEMPLASGIAQLRGAERDPWLTHTFGTGELILAAAGESVSAILLGIGGSATNDVGLGALSALGLTPIDHEGKPVSPAPPAEWNRICGFGGSMPDLPPIRIACDVENPLLGKTGCSATYGPQKGLRSEDLPAMESNVARMAALLCRHFDRPFELATVPGSGAAGGIGFGLQCALDADFISGNRLVAAWLDLERRLDEADLLITGEGRFDASSLQGKGPGALLRRALDLGKAVHVFCGSVETGLSIPDGVVIHPVTPDGMPLDLALQKAPELLREAVSRAFCSAG